MKIEVQDIIASKAFEKRQDLWDYTAKLINESEIDGLNIEFGVYQGTTLNYFAERVDGKKLYGFDCFDGLPENFRPSLPKGAFACPPPTVRENCELVIGLFQDSLPGFLKEHSGPARYIHVDSDIYSSCKYVLEAMNDRIVPGTLILFDELFGFPEYLDHEIKALNEWMEEYGRDLEIIAFNNGAQDAWSEQALGIVRK